MPKPPRQKFTYEYSREAAASGCVCRGFIAVPTTEYRFAVEHTFSRIEMEKFERQEKPLEAAIKAAIRRGWPWFGPEEYEFLKAIFRESSLARR